MLQSSFSWWVHQTSVDVTVGVSLNTAQTNISIALTQITTYSILVSNQRRRVPIPAPFCDWVWARLILTSYFWNKRAKKTFGLKKKCYFCLVLNIEDQKANGKPKPMTRRARVSSWALLCNVMVRITANQYSAVLGDIPPYVSGLSRIKVHPFQQLYVILFPYLFTRKSKSYRKCCGKRFQSKHIEAYPITCM